MMRFVTALIVAALLHGGASAQQAPHDFTGKVWTGGGQQFAQGGMMPGPGTVHSTGGGSYTGFGDLGLSGVKVYYSCARSYTAALAATNNNLCDIADASTGSTFTCTMKAASTGFADLTSSLCTAGTLTVAAFCTLHTSCVVTKMYDQTGATACSGSVACDIVQATNALQPALTFSVLNSLPCPTFGDSGNKRLASSASITSISTPFSYSGVAKNGVSNGNFNVVIEAGTSGVSAQLGYLTTTHYYLFEGSAANSSVTISSNASHAVQGMFAATSSASKIAVDTTTDTVDPGAAAAINGTIVLGNDAGGGTGYDGSVCEGVIMSGDQSGNFGTINTNQHGSNGYNF